MVSMPDTAESTSPSRPEPLPRHGTAVTDVSPWVSTGHEIQSRGFDHRELDTLTPEQLRHDLSRAKGVVEGAVGCGVTGYRAAKFSITQSNPWALEVLATHLPPIY